MQYTFIAAFDKSVLISRVNEKIKEGWIPQGGISITRKHVLLGGSVGYFFAQAMIKEESERIDDGI